MSMSMSTPFPVNGETVTPPALLVPEILTSIAGWLSREDFLNSILVSRSWHSHLIPLLWQTMVLPQRWRMVMATDKSFPEKEIFQRHGGLIRSISCNNLNYCMDYLVPFVNHLTELQVADLTDEALSLLNLNLNSLTSIKFKRESELAKRSFKVLKFLKAIQNCPHLETLQLDDFVIDQDFESEDDYKERRRICNRDRKRPPLISPDLITMPGSELAYSSGSEHNKKDAVALFYQILHRVRTLDILNNVIKTPPPNKSDVFYQIRKLGLVGSTMNYMDQLQLVSQCQYLTHLKLEFTRETERIDLEKLTEIQLQINCPNITHLNISYSALKDDEIAALLLQLPRLTCIRAQRTHIGEKTMEILAGRTSDIRHQLTELDLVDVLDMKSAWVQQILCSCAGLRRFWATEIHAREIVMNPSPWEKADASINTEMIAEAAKNNAFPENTNHIRGTNSGWVCLELEELQLSIIGISSKSSLEDQILIYKQLSKLTKLQVLSLGGNPMSTWFRVLTLELSLEKGFGILKTLKDLRVFNFSYMSHELGMSEVEFMMENWPRLRRITGTIGTKVNEVDLVESVIDGEEAQSAKQSKSRKAKIERHELYIRRKWPLLELSSR